MVTIRHCRVITHVYAVCMITLPCLDVYYCILHCILCILYIHMITPQCLIVYCILYCTVYILYICTYIWPPALSYCILCICCIVRMMISLQMSYCFLRILFCGCIVSVRMASSWHPPCDNSCAAFKCSVSTAYHDLVGFAVSSIYMRGGVFAACVCTCSVCVLGWWVYVNNLTWYLLLIWVLIIPQKLLIIIAGVTQLSLHLRNTYMCLCYSMFICNECLLTFFCFLLDATVFVCMCSPLPTHAVEFPGNHSTICVCVWPSEPYSTAW